MDLSLGLEGTHVVVTGGAGMIGSVVVDAFLAAGAIVSSLDIAHAHAAAADGRRPRLYQYRVDTTDEPAVVSAFALAGEVARAPVAGCVALAALDLSALPHHPAAGAASLTAEQFRRTLDVNVTGTFLTARAWMHALSLQDGPSSSSSEPESSGRRLNRSLVLVGSESGAFGERGNADYAASKAAVQVGLLKSLAADVGRNIEGARVNAIAPGPVDTPQFRQECRENPEQYWLDAQATTALRQPVPMEAVAKTILYLASDNFSSHVHGQVVHVDGGKQGKLLWTKEESTQGGS